MLLNTNNVPSSVKVDGQFALFIKKERAKQNLNISQFAKLCNVQRSTLSMMETRLCNPTVDNAWKMLQGLGLGFHDFDKYMEQQEGKL